MGPRLALIQKLLDNLDSAQKKLEFALSSDDAEEKVRIYGICRISASSRADQAGLLDRSLQSLRVARRHCTPRLLRSSRCTMNGRPTSAPRPFRY